MRNLVDIIEIAMLRKNGLIEDIAVAQEQAFKFVKKDQNLDEQQKEQVIRQKTIEDQEILKRLKIFVNEIKWDLKQQLNQNIEIYGFDNSSDSFAHCFGAAANRLYSGMSCDNLFYLIRDIYDKKIEQ